MVPARLDDLTKDTGGPKDLPDDPFIELKPICGNERNIFDGRSLSDIPKQGQRVLVAASADHGRSPKPRPDIDGCEDPDRLLLALGDRSDLVGLKLRGPEPGCVLIVEATTGVARFFQPAIDSIPADVLDSGDRRLVQAFDAQSRNLIKGGAAVLEPIVRRPGIGAERFLACLASVSTTPSPTSLIETKTDDLSGSGFSRRQAFPVRTAETFHGFWNPDDGRTVCQN